jgi:hypothetical protein
MAKNPEIQRFSCLHLPAAADARGSWNAFHGQRKIVSNDARMELNLSLRTDRLMINFDRFTCPAIPFSTPAENDQIRFPRRAKDVIIAIGPKDDRF